MSSSSKQTIGYKYYLGMHIDLCHGPIDKITRLEFDKRTAWCGESTGGRISVNAPKLFGGEKRQGGIVGEIDFLTGAPDQLANDYLEAQLGAPIPAFRGVAALVFRQVYLGMSEYLKPLSVRAQRVYVGTDGAAQWYPEKAGIPSCGGCTANAAINLSLDLSGSMAGARLAIAKEAVKGFLDYLDGLIELYEAALDVRIIGWGGTTENYLAHEAVAYTNATQADIAALKTWVDARTSGYGTWFSSGIQGVASFFAASDKLDRINIWITDGEPNEPGNPPGGEATASADATTAGATLLGITGIQAFGINIVLTNTSETAKMSNRGVSVVSDGNSDALEAAILAAVASGQDMNPAHAIRECITDPAWAMSYPAADVDDDSFTVAADQLHAEGMGWGQVWDQQGEIGEYIDRITRHIDAELYIDRRTGKYTLQLIRDDYDADDPEQCPVLGVNEILAVENFGAPALGELKNSVTVRYWNCETGNVAAVTVHDQALALMQGGTIGETFDYLGFSKSEIATRVAFREQRALGTRRRSCTIYANRAARNLAPGKVFKMDYPDWTDSRPIVMRVVEIAFGNGKTKVIRIKCIEDVFSLGPAPVVGSMPTRWADPSTRPISATDRLVFEAPYWEFVRQAGQAQAELTLTYDDLAGFLMGTARRPGVATNAEMHADAGAGYEFGATVDFAPWGIVAADVPAEAGPTVVTLSDHEDLDEVAIGQLARLGAEEVRVDAIDLEADPVEVTVGRGCLDTVPAPHAAGEKLVFWQDFAAHSNAQYASGEAIDVKLLPSSGAGVVSLGVAPADSLTFAQRAFRPYPPGDFKINGEAYPAVISVASLSASDAIAVTLAHRDRKLQTGGAIEDTTAGDIGPEASTTYTVQLRNPSDDSLFAEQTGLTGTAANFSLSGYTGSSLKVLLWAVRDGLASWQTHEWEAPLSLTPWTPAVYAASAEWYDFSDSAQITLESGIRNVLSKGVGTGLSQESIPASRPSYVVAAYNGLNCARFDGANDFLYMNNPSRFRNRANAVVIVVRKCDAVPSAVQTIINHNNNAAAGSLARVFMAVSAAGKPQVGGRRLDADAFAAVSGADNVTTGLQIQVGRYDWATAKISMRIDGSDAFVDAAFQTAGNTSNTDAAAYSSLGASRSSTSTIQAFDGDIAEVILIPSSVPAADIERFEGYLAWKWGIQGSLPGGHPYKDDPPYL